MNGYLSVKNWDRFQHYKKRNPPWIRLYISVLDDWTFQKLSPKQQRNLMFLWLIASRCDNKIPNDIAFLKCRISGITKENIKELVDSGFINASTMLAPCNQNSIPETETDIQRQRTDSVSFLPSVEKETERTPLPPPEKKSRKQKPDPVVAATLALPPGLDTDRFKAALSDWVVFRKELHKPLTKSSMKKQLEFLDGLGEERACKTIENSITQGYQGLIEPKSNGIPAGAKRDKGRIIGSFEEEDMADAPF